ncbi:unnamed protein product [Cyprideis torosa]|uniref:Uncharacterized protein n=1 Tax=Cyprideis torosa TaxID=163714 RepID=A0A7R8W3V2_9CRUS|nr:unnamed protein product [Cyprideis torosa]CAG0883433.1 unnamed protein product [Cyprideis torosa]
MSDAKDRRIANNAAIIATAPAGLLRESWSQQWQSTFQGPIVTMERRWTVCVTSIVWIFFLSCAFVISSSSDAGRTAEVEDHRNDRVVIDCQPMETEPEEVAVEGSASVEDVGASVEGSPSMEEEGTSNETQTEEGVKGKESSEEEPLEATAETESTEETTASGEAEASKETEEESKEQETAETGDSSEGASDETKSEESKSAEEEGATSEEEASSSSSSSSESSESEEETFVEGEKRNKESLEMLQTLELEEEFISKTEKTLKELKKIYDSSVKPLETTYKYNDISTRHVTDSDVHQKPTVLVVGPWGTGKTTAIKYLLGETDRDWPGGFAEEGPFPKDQEAFTIFHFGETETLEGSTELASDWSFASLHKHGENALSRLKGMKLNNNMLQKVTFVEAPGIMETTKDKEARNYPFNDMMQWFIDRADLILVVLDPSKLDFGLEMEALIDQLKGREEQTRILLNKADTITPAELFRVQNLISWHLSPMFGGNRPPVFYATSLHDMDYNPKGISRLIAQNEEKLYQDLLLLPYLRVDNRAAYLRRHAVRVRNHSKIINCYLKAYTRNKGLFSNKKKVAEAVAKNPHQYMIYEGLGLMNNVSRYDLPDPNNYLSFFKMHFLWDFPKFQDTCTFFKGCQHDKLDVAVAYDFSEAIVKYKTSLADGTALKFATVEESGTTTKNKSKG